MGQLGRLDPLGCLEPTGFRLHPKPPEDEHPTSALVNFLGGGGNKSVRTEAAA